VNRLTHPGSEHALAAWLEDFYVVTAQRSRWKAEWKPSRRVKVSFEQLRLWYETLDDLLAQKPQIERTIWQQLRDLFSLEPEIVLGTPVDRPPGPVPNRCGSCPSHYCPKPEHFPVVRSTRRANSTTGFLFNVGMSRKL
jgi:hypothetical protein